MSIALIAHAEAHATSDPQTSAIDTTGASLIVVGISDYSGGPGTTLSDSKGNTWTNFGVIGINSAGQMNTQAYYAWNPTVGSGHTFTGTGTSVFACLVVAAFSGIKTSSDPLDVFASKSNYNVSNGTPMVFASLTFPAGDLVVSVAGIPFGAATSTWSSVAWHSNAFSITDQFHQSGVTEGSALAWVEVPSSATDDLSWTPGQANASGAGVTGVFAPAPAGQFARPISDVADGSWTPSTGSDLYATIDETTASDTDYDRSGSAPVADTAIVQLTSLSTPDSGTTTLRVRGKTT